MAVLLVLRLAEERGSNVRVTRMETEQCKIKSKTNLGGAKGKRKRESEARARANGRRRRRRRLSAQNPLPPPPPPLKHPSHASSPFCGPVFVVVVVMAARAL